MTDGNATSVFELCALLGYFSRHTKAVRDVPVRGLPYLQITSPPGGTPGGRIKYALCVDLTTEGRDGPERLANAVAGTAPQSAVVEFFDLHELGRALAGHAPVVDWQFDTEGAKP